MLNVTPEFGLSDILSGEVSPAQAVTQTNIPNLHLISTGSYPKNPSELLMDNRFKELLSNAQKRYDYIIIDTPPVLAVTDAVVVGQHAGTVLLVSRYGNTTTKELAISAERLRQNKITIKGVILNGIKREANSTYDYYYSYITPTEGKKNSQENYVRKTKSLTIGKACCQKGRLKFSDDLFIINTINSKKSPNLHHFAIAVPRSRVQCQHGYFRNKYQQGIILPSDFA